MGSAPPVHRILSCDPRSVPAGAPLRTDVPSEAGAIWLSGAGNWTARSPHLPSRESGRANDRSGRSGTQPQGDDLSLCHVPPPVELADELELGHGPILPLRVVDLVETGPHSPLAAFVKVAPATF